MIWIDFDNAPHVPLLVPIVKALQDKGHPVLATARDYTQTIPLLEQSGITYHKVGKSFGKKKIAKVISLAFRLVHLYIFVRKSPIKLAVNHGSRTQTACARLLHIPCLVMADYEYTELSLFRKYASRFCTPGHIPLQTLLNLGFKRDRIMQYEGFKEYIYLEDFKPDLNFRVASRLPVDSILVTLRPPGTAGNYHDAFSEELCLHLLKRLLGLPDCYTVILPKNNFEKKELLQFLRANARYKNWLIPEKPLPGLQLIWHSDLVVSGGGTMNREGALLGTPTYSIFTARKGAVDQHLEDIGKLTFLTSIDDIDKLEIKPGKVPGEFSFKQTSVRDKIVDIIIGMKNKFSMDTTVQGY